MIFSKSLNLQHRNLLCEKLRAKIVILATALFNLQRYNVARQVVRKCCPYYLTFKPASRCSLFSKVNSRQVNRSYAVGPMQFNLQSFNLSYVPMFSHFGQIQSSRSQLSHLLFMHLPYKAF